MRPNESLQPEANFAFLDDFLTRWDQFAQGDVALLPSLNADAGRFHDELATAVDSDRSRALSRVVRFLTLQVGGAVPVDTRVGRALAAAAGENALPVTELRGEWVYFAGDVYFWWEAHRSEFEASPPYEEWRQRPFVRQTVVPMYAAARARADRSA